MDFDFEPTDEQIIEERRWETPYSVSAARARIAKRKPGIRLVWENNNPDFRPVPKHERVGHKNLERMRQQKNRRIRDDYNPDDVA